MKNFKIFVALLLIFCFIITAISCAPAPSDPDLDGEQPETPENNEDEGENGDKIDTGTPEDENQPGSEDNTQGENQPGNGDDTQGDDKPADEIDMDYETLLSLSEAEQLAFVQSFDSLADFFVWYNAAFEKYKEEHPGIDSDGDINLDIFG